MKFKSEIITGSCQVCGVDFKEQDMGDGVFYPYDSPEEYSYRGFSSCSDCFEELQELVDNKRQRIIDDFDSRSVETIPQFYPSGVENPMYDYVNENKTYQRQKEIASNPNWEEENEYRKGILYTHKEKRKNE